MISDERADKSLRFLASTDEDCAILKANVIGYENEEKSILGMEYLQASGTVTEREYIARVSALRKEWEINHKQAVKDYETLKNKRLTETLIFEMWRSLNANRRQAS